LLKKALVLNKNAGSEQFRLVIPLREPVTLRSIEKIGIVAIKIHVSGFDNWICGIAIIMPTDKWMLSSDTL
jgi:hypothetical protein